MTEIVLLITGAVVVSLVFVISNLQARVRELEKDR